MVNRWGTLPPRLSPQLYVASKSVKISINAMRQGAMNPRHYIAC